MSRGGEGLFIPALRYRLVLVFSGPCRGDVSISGRGGSEL